jgi:chemotaxis protein MotB
LGDLVNVDEKTGNITLGENQVTFKEGSSALGQRGRRLLRRIVEPLAEVAFSDKYRDDLDRIVVEGHTNSNRRPDEPFFNWRLSASRALTVVRFLLHASGKNRERYNHYLEAVGKAEREPIMIDGREDLVRSRRIVIKVALDDRRLVDRLARDLERAIERASKASWLNGSANGPKEPKEWHHPESAERKSHEPR